MDGIQCDGEFTKKLKSMYGGDFLTACKVGTDTCAFLASYDREKLRVFASLLGKNVTSYNSPYAHRASRKRYAIKLDISEFETSKEKLLLHGYILVIVSYTQAGYEIFNTMEKLK